MLIETRDKRGSDEARKRDKLAAHLCAKLKPPTVKQRPRCLQPAKSPSLNSDATVKLITGAMDRLAADKSMGRAEAMRQSMLALVEQGTPQEAHPAFWAPFVVVGEGGFTAPVHLDKGKPGEVDPATWSTSTIAAKSDDPH